MTAAGTVSATRSSLIQQPTIDAVSPTANAPKNVANDSGTPLQIFAVSDKFDGATPIGAVQVKGREAPIQLGKLFDMRN